MDTLYIGPDGAPRCRWCGSAPEFLAYHDQEWGYPVADDTRLFEKLCLEGFQSGLSWRTIPASVALSKELKRRGWKFVGPTTVFAFMQAMGLVNDHATGCASRDKAAQARARFKVPKRR